MFAFRSFEPDRSCSPRRIEWPLQFSRCTMRISAAYWDCIRLVQIVAEPENPRVIWVKGTIESAPPIPAVQPLSTCGGRD